MVVVEVLPLSQLFLEIDVILVGEQLVELLLVGPDRVNPERELLDHAVYEIDGVLLSMTSIDPQSPNPGSIVNGSISESTDLLAFAVLESKERHINLDVVAVNLPGITAGTNGSTTDVSGQTSQVVTNKGPMNARAGRLDAVITLQIASNPLRTKMVDSSEMMNLLDYLKR